MESKVVAYYFSEISESAFSEASPPFVKSSIAAKYYQQNLQIFKSCGGLGISDSYENEKKHVRKSTWLNSEGYGLWQKQIAATGYIEERNNYHRLHRIKAEVSGPHEVLSDS